MATTLQNTYCEASELIFGRCNRKETIGTATGTRFEEQIAETYIAMDPFIQQVSRLARVAQTQSQLAYAGMQPFNTHGLKEQIDFCHM